MGQHGVNQGSTWGQMDVFGGGGVCCLGGGALMGDGCVEGGGQVVSKYGAQISRNRTNEKPQWFFARKL